MTVPTDPRLMLVLTIVGVVAGLLGGGVGGYRLGRGVRGRRRAYWTLNVAVVLGCAVLDFAGLVLGQDALAYSAVGLMGGLITGMKYGYVDSMRVWGGAGAIEAASDAAEEEPLGDPPVDGQSERSRPAN